jgi:hypothetical protein
VAGVRLVAPAAILSMVFVAVACAPPPPPPTQPVKTTTTVAHPTTTAKAGTPTSTSTSTTSTTSTTTTLPATTTTVPDTKHLYATAPVDGWGILKEGSNDQYVDAVALSGDAVYAVGSFTHAYHNGLSANRANVMATSASTGALLPFVADTNGPVYAVATDGTSVYIGGDFTSVNGVARNRLARLDRTTGAVVTGFNAGAGGIVRDLLVVGGTLYVGGEFNLLDNATRHHAAAINTTNGGLVTSFDPNVNGKVLALEISPDHTRLYLGGAFTALGTDARLNLAAVNPASGAALATIFSRANDVIMDLSVRSNGVDLYGGGGGGLNSAVDWDAVSGVRKWSVRADGDTQAVQYSNGYVYSGFHDGFGGNTNIRLLALDPDNGTVDPTFQPVMSAYPGVYALAADGNHLVAGGYFPTVAADATSAPVNVRGLAVFP